LERYVEDLHALQPERLVDNIGARYGEVRRKCKVLIAMANLERKKREGWLWEKDLVLRKTRRAYTPYILGWREYSLILSVNHSRLCA
jgi:hypothetical protein